MAWVIKTSVVGSHGKADAYVHWDPEHGPTLVKDKNLATKIDNYGNAVVSLEEIQDEMNVYEFELEKVD